MAILEFNKGATGFEEVLRELAIPPGHHLQMFSASSTKRRRSDASKHENPINKKKRIQRKLFKAGLQDMYQSKEGEVYKSGGFNDLKAI